MSILFLYSCKKQSNQENADNCPNIMNATLYSNSPVTIGGSISFGTQEVGGYRIYSWTGPNNFTSQYPDNSITAGELKNEGWYYLDLYSLTGSCQRFDSLYIDVKLPQGTPSCSITTNSTTFNNLSTDTYTSVIKHIESNYSQKALEATGAGNMTIYFHTHWRTAEPEDGLYTTIDTPLFDPVDANYNKVFITTTKSSLYWSSAANQTVYISHVGSKLQVRFCSLNMSAYNGTSYFTIASGNIVEK